MVTSDQVLGVIDECEPMIRARYARKLNAIGNRYDIDDLLQATRLKAHRAVDQCRASAEDVSLRHWVLQIASMTYKTEITNHVGVAKRSVKRESGELKCDLMTRPGQNAVDTSELNESANEIIALLDELPKSQAKAVRANYIDAREYSDIAEEMGVTVNSVRLLVSRGLKQLRKLSVPYGFEMATDGTLVSNPAEASAIAMMRELHSRGWSYQLITEAATTMNLAARRGMKWTPAKIRSILND